jgi:hypothetical protein
MQFQLGSLKVFGWSSRNDCILHKRILYLARDEEKHRKQPARSIQRQDKRFYTNGSTSKLKRYPVIPEPENKQKHNNLRISLAWQWYGNILGVHSNEMNYELCL